jgi:ADP-ribosyl-[dinitrogen reductase] hydrolase
LEGAVLIELAVGDAYGAGFEYADPDFVATHNTLEGYVQHPTHSGVRPGAYTDDTQMTIAVAELLISGGPWTAKRLADQFVGVFKRDQREGYADGFYRLLREVGDGAEMLLRLNPDSDRSGAAMRAGPTGLLPTVSDVLHYAAVQARVTHATPAGIEAAQAAALAVHYCHFELGPVAEVGRWVDQQLQSHGGAGGWSQPWRGKVGARGWMSVRAALTAITTDTSGSLSEILRTCVAFTGDVDTVAAMAMAAASRSQEITRDLPRVLHRNLEGGPYGMAYLRDLDAHLLSQTSPTVTSDPTDANGPSLIGLWDTKWLYIGAMAADRVVFLARGVGWFEDDTLLSSETQRFRWQQDPDGAIRIRFTHYLYWEAGQPARMRPHWQAEPLLITARVGRGTDALDREATVLSLEGLEPTGRARRYGLIRRDIPDSDDPAYRLG